MSGLPTFLALLFVAVVVAIIYLKRPRSRSKANLVRRFDIVSDGGQRVLIRGVSKADLESTLAQFGATYELEWNPTIQWLSSDSYCVGVAFDTEPHFSFLVNFMAYPFDAEADREAIVAGLSDVVDSETGRVVPAIFYIPENDTEYDLVYIKMSASEIYEHSFQNIGWERKDVSRMPSEVEKLVNGYAG